jgi:hypothetical protein
MLLHITDWLFGCEVDVHFAPTAIVNPSRRIANSANDANDLKTKASQYFPKERIILQAVPSPAFNHDLCKQFVRVQRYFFVLRIVKGQTFKGDP